MKPPPYHIRFIIYLILLVLILVLYWFLSGYLFPKRESYIPINQCYIYQSRIPYHPIVRTYGSLINCLVMNESGGNPEAINPCDIDGRPKFGILQFGRRTWKEWCVDEYNFKDDIMDEDLQMDCCEKMIRDGQLWRWGTKNLCL